MKVRATLRSALHALGFITDPGAWLEDHRVLACPYPRTDAAFAALATDGVSVLVNLHDRAHAPLRLARHGLTELHLPIPDFAAPTPEQLDRGVETIARAIAAGQRVAVHCGGGLGRTGTLLACYLVSRGFGADAAVARICGRMPRLVKSRRYPNMSHARSKSCLE